MWMKKVVEKVDGTDEEEDAARKAEREAERAREEAERIRKEAEREAEREAEEAEREAEREAARAEREARFEKPQDGELGSFERRPVRPIDEGSPDMAALRALAQPEAPPPARVAPGAAFSRARRDQFPPGLDAALREQGNLDSTIQSSPFGEPTPNLLGTPPRRAQAGRPIQEGAAPVERAPRVPRGVTLMTPEQEQAQLERFGLQNPWAGEPQTPAAPPRTPNVNMEIGEISTTPTARVLEDEIVTTPTPPATPNIVQEQVQLDQQQRQPVLGEFERRPVLPVAEGDMRQRELDRIQQRAAVVSNAATPPPQLPENRTPTSGTTAPMGETPPSGIATPVEAGEGVVSTPASAPTGGSLASSPSERTDSRTVRMEREPVVFPESSLGEFKDEGFVPPSITQNTLSPQSEEPLSAEEEIARAQRRERIFRILRAIGAIGSGIAVGATAASGRNPAFLAPIIRGLGGALGQAQPVEDTRARLAGRQMDERTATQARELDLNELRQQAVLRQAELQRAQQQEQFAAREARLAGATEANLERSRMQLELEAEARNPNSAMSRTAQQQVKSLRDALPERFQARFPDSAIEGLNVEQAERMASAIYSLVDERGGSVAGGGVGTSSAPRGAAAEENVASITARANELGIDPVINTDSRGRQSVDTAATQRLIREREQAGFNAEQQGYQVAPGIFTQRELAAPQVTSLVDGVSSYRDAIAALSEVQEIAREYGRTAPISPSARQEIEVPYAALMAAVARMKNTGVINPTEAPAIEAALPNPVNFSQAVFGTYDAAMRSWVRRLRNSMRSQLRTLSVTEDSIDGLVRESGRLIGEQEQPQRRAAPPRQTRYRVTKPNGDSIVITNQERAEAARRAGWTVTEVR